MARARTRLTQEERKARTREAILAAAVRLFARQGVEATSLDQIAEAAGYTKGAIYGPWSTPSSAVTW
jgi:AcrR family transcriptional regulator